MNDLRFAFRQLAKQPAFSLVAITALGLGIGASTAIFSVVNAVLLRPLPYKGPDRIVSLWSTNPKDEVKQEVVSYPDFTDWRQQARSFETMAGFIKTKLILANADAEPEQLFGTQIVGDFFGTLGVEPAIGRKILPEEIGEGGQRVVILSRGLWQRRFGGKPDIVGQQITLSGNQYTIVGIMPSSFHDPEPSALRSAEVWIPLVITDFVRLRRGDLLRTIGRMKSGVTIGEARAEMKAIAAGLEKQFPVWNNGWSVTVEPLRETITGNIRPVLLLLLAAVGFLLLIACANVANLLLVRATVRQREIAVRAALGASRSRIVRQLLTKNLLLALLGGVAGLFFAWWALHAVLGIDAGNIPRLNSIRIDTPVLLFTLAVSLVTAIVFGLAPALTVSRLRVNESLKQGGRGAGEGAGGRRLRTVLAIVEMALSLVLLVGAGLLIKSFVRLQEVTPGFNPEHLLAAELSLPAAKYAENQQVINFYTELIARLEHQPGVESVAVTSTLPLAGPGDLLYFTMEGRAVVRTERKPDAEVRVVNENYFRTMQIPLHRGRLLVDADSIKSAVINEMLARKYFPNEDPIGRRITFRSVPGSDHWWTIGGVVADVRQDNLAAEPYPQLYQSYQKQPRRSLTVVIRTVGDPVMMVNTLRQQVWSLDRQQPLYNVRSVERALEDSIAPPRFNTLLTVILASVALVLAIVGIYAVIAYSVTQRTGEIGIRIALGATTGHVVRLVISYGIFIAGIGLAVGLAAAMLVTRFMSPLLYGTTPTDPLTYVVLILLLGVVALVACYVPARKATQVDPVIALRHE